MVRTECGVEHLRPSSLPAGTEEGSYSLPLRRSWIPSLVTWDLEAYRVAGRSLPPPRLSGAGLVRPNSFAARGPALQVLELGLRLHPRMIVHSSDYDDLASHLADLSTQGHCWLPMFTTNAANFSRFSRGRWHLRRHSAFFGAFLPADGLPPLRGR